MTFLLGLKIILAFSILLCKALKIRINLEKAVNEEIELSQSSYKLNSSICGSVADKIKSPNFSIFKQLWNGYWSSLPLITIFGKSNKCYSYGSSIPFLITIICLGCSSIGQDLIKAATSSAVFHFANWPNLFCPSQTLTWMIF